MEWLPALIRGDSAAASILVLALAISLGLMLGSLKVRGVGLGIAGVLFAGLAFGHFGFGMNEHVLEWAREFGLILFVYTIGLQVGPGFVASLRRQGLPLNLMAAGIVLTGVAITVTMHLALGLELPVAVGLFSGATTNTPSLAAAQQAIRDIPNIDEVAGKLPSLAYAVAYPFGIMGIILTMLLVRNVFRVNLAKEEEQLREKLDVGRPQLIRANLEVRNPNLDGVAVKNIPMLDGSGVVVSRVLQPPDIEPRIPKPETVLHTGDVLLVVGTKEQVDQVRLIIGWDSPVDLRTLPSAITTKRLIVTHKPVLGKSLGELDMVRRFGVAITRVSRAEFEFTPTRDFRLQFGDTVLAVGEEAAIGQVARVLGDSPKALNHPLVIPIFIGIALGVLVGSWPISVPGVPGAVKLGLAGGPLLVAILLSRLGRIGPLVWYMPISANFMLRELGIVLFLACVGLRAGPLFVEKVMSGQGLQWMALGAAITLLPLLLVALVARLFMKLNYLSLCGLLAGSMTDPPALAFANTVSGSDAPSVAYATVYPLTMILRVVSAQMMVILLMR